MSSQDWFTFWEVVAAIGTIAVIVGLFIEYGLEVFSFLKFWGVKEIPAACIAVETPLTRKGSALVVFGIIVELIGGFGVIVQADRIETQHRREINELDQRVEDLRASNNALEATIQPRDLSIDQQRELANVCRPFAHHKVRLDAYALDAEGLRLAVEIKAALTVAHIEILPSNFMIAGGSIDMGIRVTAPESDRELALAIVTFFDGQKFALGKSAITAPGTPVVIEVGIKPIPAWHVLTSEQALNR